MKKKAKLEPRICKNPKCQKEHDGVQVKRSLGDYSTAYLLGYCCARCYTKGVMSTKRIEPKVMKVPINEFLENGGTLHEGRKIYSTNNPNFPFAEYLSYDAKLSVHLGKNATYKSFPLASSVDLVEIEVKPIYK